jgi:repressor LexA
MPHPAAPRRRSRTAELPPVTKRQKQILDFFRDYVAEHEISPTLEEIAQAFGLNKVTVFGHVAELERKGILRRSAPNVSRGLQVVAAPRADDHRDYRPDASRRRDSVQLLGRIAAGAPIEALEVPEHIDLRELAPPGADVYLLRVSGDSMIEDAICDGDLVLVERRSDARDGDVVVAVLPGEVATLKRLYREPSHTATPGRFRLQPANAALEPTFVDELEVRGVVVGVIRRY